MAHQIVDIRGVEELDAGMDRVAKAQEIYSQFSQVDVDRIVNSACDHFLKHAESLAQHAADETRMGLAGHKVAKNIFAVDYVRETYRNSKTCGVISSDPASGIDVVASPMGVIAAVVPTTNPTSTVAFKALCCLKTRNAIVVAPHPRAKACSFEALRIIIEGAVAAGAPADIAACISQPSIDLSNKLMTHPKVACILATGGPGMVKAAYSSGKPSVGVGPGNVPVVVDEHANLSECANNVILSKNFDYGVICSSEQVVIAHTNIYDQLKTEFELAGGYFLNEDEKTKVAQFLFKDGGALNADVVGQSPLKIASMAGIEVPPTTTLLIGEFDEVNGSDFAREKLSPVLGFTRRENLDQAFQAAVDVLRRGGEGHTACYYTNPDTQGADIAEFASRVIVTRLLINQPTAPGGIGGVYNSMNPSMTLGCGSYGGNYVSENVGPQHLLNYKRVVRILSDRDVVRKNAECLAPPFRVRRCALEIVILSILVAVRTPKFSEKYPEAAEHIKACIEYARQTGSDFSAVKAAVEFFNDSGLYAEAEADIAHARFSSRDYNLSIGTILPVVFPRLVQSCGQWSDFSILNSLNITADSRESAVELIKELHTASGLDKEIHDSDRLRIKNDSLVSIIGA